MQQDKKKLIYSSNLVQQAVFELIATFKKNNFPYNKKKEHLLDLIFVSRILHAMIDNQYQRPNYLRPNLKLIHQALLKQLKSDGEFDQLWKDINNLERVLN